MTAPNPPDPWPRAAAGRSPTRSQLTNDTSVPYPDDADFVVRNDLGVNIVITDRASTRVS